MNTIPQGSTPVPDPTILTTQQLVREIAASREIVEAKYDTRLAAMDTATELNKQATDRIPTLICEKVAALEKLHNEKFASIEKQFVERDTRITDISVLNQKALDAALQAQKESAGKTELSFTKQISDLTAQFQTQNKALDERLNDLKGRLDRGEGVTGGQKEQKTESKTQGNFLLGLIIIGGISLLGIVVNVIALLAK